MNQDDIYRDLAFPEAPEDRPYTFIDMVATIDGKILSGDRDDHVIDLGSALDHQLMKRIASQADAVLVGASTLRTVLSTWDPGTPYRIVVSKSGTFDYTTKFFKTGHAIVASPTGATFTPPEPIEHFEAGIDETDLIGLLQNLRRKDIHKLLVLGGSEMNAQLLSKDLIDELFLTIAPKVKLGRDVPTYADGEPLPREGLLGYRIVESHVVADELFIRYRRV